MPKCSSKSRMNGPMAQEALLSFALPSRSALRPSKSRRLTSLPSVAPTTRPVCAHRQHDLRFRVVPLRLRVDADVRAGANRGHRLTLGENLRVGTDADLEILGPHALRDQHVLEPARLVRARPDLLQVRADDRRDRRAQAFGSSRVAACLFLDDALEQARDEGDAARLDRLQVARREQPRRVAVAGRPAPSSPARRRAARSRGSGPARRIDATGSSRLRS